MSAVLYLIIGIVALGYYLVRKRFNYWTDRGFPSTTGSFPFGFLQGVGSKMITVEKMDPAYKQFKGKAKAVGTYFFHDPTLMPIDPELTKNIYVREFSSFHDRGFYYNKKDDPATASILSLDGQEWRDRRTRLTPIFTSGKMKMMFNTVDTISDKLIEVINKNLEKSNTIDMKDMASRYTNDVIGNVAFGLDVNCLVDPKSEYVKQGRRFFDPTPFELLKFLFAAAFPNLCRKLHVKIIPEESSNFFMNTFAQTLKYREKNDIERNDFVTLLLGLKDFLTPVELASEAFLIYTAGFETSSTLISFSLYELALNPDIQEKLRKEIKSEVAKNNGKFTYEMIFGAKYFDQVINESLRKFPPIPSTVRKSTKDYIIPGTRLTIEKGTNIFLNIYAFHHDPDFFTEPQKFDPERFSPDDDVRIRHPNTFTPFGDGPRNCIGMRFGLMQSKLAIAKIVHSYKISPNVKTPIPMKFIPSSPFLAPVGGMPLSFRRIE